MGASSRDRARRVITLVDELYNARSLLVLSAAGSPDALFSGDGGGIGGGSKKGKKGGAADEAILEARFLEQLEQLQDEGGAVEGAFVVVWGL